ncbi:O-antigen ligase family protein [Psychroserpens sp. BH13MA-6]
MKVSSRIISAVAPLLLILIVTVFSAFLHNPSTYDYVRDLVYILKPILGIVFGFYFAQHFINKTVLIQALIWYCFLAGLFHIINVVLNANLSQWDTAYIRYIGGKDSMIEAFGLAFFIAYLRRPEFQIFSRRFNKAYLIIAIISIIFYLSRTTFIGVVLFLISFYGFTKANQKQIIYLAVVLVLSISFMVSLQFMDIKRGATGFESFLYKLKIAPSEIFNSEINTNDVSDLWDNWRAYEAKSAFDTLAKEDSVTPYITGMGLGSMINLGFEAPLGNERMQYIPHIHNGYVFIFFKAGIIGFLLLLIWLTYLYSYIYKKAKIKESKLFNRAISGLGLYLFFSSLVITGIYNVETIPALLLGLMIGLSYHVQPLKSKHIKMIA